MKEAEEAVEEEEVEDQEEDQVVVSRKSGLHSPSSEDSLSSERSNPSKKFTLSPSPSRNTKSLTDLSATSTINFLMKLCAFSQSKSKPRLVKELDSRPSLLVEIDKDTLVLESRSLRKSRLPSKVPS